MFFYYESSNLIRGKREDNIFLNVHTDVNIAREKRIEETREQTVSPVAYSASRRGKRTLLLAVLLQFSIGRVRADRSLTSVDTAMGSRRMLSFGTKKGDDEEDGTSTRSLTLSQCAEIMLTHH